MASTNCLPRLPTISNCFLRMGVHESVCARMSAHLHESARARERAQTRTTARTCSDKHSRAHAHACIGLV
eukprot:15444919-Alexandrium_andersonii.AAC.1